MGVSESHKLDMKWGFSLERQPHMTHYQSSCPNMVTETFGRWCWQTSHCTAGQWHAVACGLWLTHSHRGCCSWVLTTRTRTRITLLSSTTPSHRDRPQPWLIWSSGSGWFWSLYYSGMKGLYNVVQAVITSLMQVQMHFSISHQDMFIMYIIRGFCVATVKPLCKLHHVLCVNTLSLHQRPNFLLYQADEVMQYTHMLLSSLCQPVLLSHQQTHPVMLMSILLLLLSLLRVRIWVIIWVGACLYCVCRCLQVLFKDFVTLQPLDMV